MKNKKVFMYSFSVALLVATVSLLPSIARADMAPVQFWGNGVVTTDPKGIVLTKENLDIEMIEDTAPDEWNDSFKVKATFYFNNPGEATDLVTFFPIPGSHDIAGSDNSEEEKNEYLLYAMAYTTYELTLNGDKVTDFTTDITEYDPLMEYTDMSFYSFAIFSTLHFKPGQNVLIVEYQSPITYNYEGGLYSINYILTSGALWADPIGELNISVKFPSEMPAARYVSSYSFTQEESNTLQYQATNTDPTEELTIDYIPGPVWEKVGSIITENRQPTTMEEKAELCSFLQYEIGNNGMVLPEGEGILYDIYWQNVIDLEALGNHDFDLDYGMYQEQLLRDALNDINTRLCENEESSDSLTDKINQFSEDKTNLLDWINNEAVFEDDDWGKDYLIGLINLDELDCEVFQAEVGDDTVEGGISANTLAIVYFAVGGTLFVALSVAGFFVFKRIKRQKKAKKQSTVTK